MQGMLDRLIFQKGALMGGNRPMADDDLQAPGINRQSARLMTVTGRQGVTVRFKMDKPRWRNRSRFQTIGPIRDLRQCFGSVEFRGPEH